MRVLKSGAVALVMLGISCSSTPAPRWQTGGARIALGSAIWKHGDDEVELKPTGDVVAGDEVILRIDAAGRISDAERNPVAVLMPDGRLVSPRDEPLGWVGAGVAYGKERDHPSVAIYPGGGVVAYEEQGATGRGYWLYCDGPLLWTCTLVTHVVEVTGADTGSGGGSALEALRLLELLKLAH